MMKKRWPSLLLAGALAAMLAPLGSASGRAGDLSAIRAAGTIRIGTEGTYAPFTFHDASGALSGFDVDIGRAVAERLGVKPTFVEGKWDGLIAGLDADRYDVVINEVTITDARKAKYDFSDPYIVSKAALVVRADDDTIKGFADLKGKSSAHTLSSNYAKLAESFGAKLVATDGFDQSIALVLAGRADATINDSLSFLDFKKRKPDAAVRIAAEQPDAEQEGIIMPKGRPDLLQAVDKALGDMKADGTYLAISQKYFGADVSR